MCNSILFIKSTLLFTVNGWSLKSNFVGVRRLLFITQILTNLTTNTYSIIMSTKYKFRQFIEPSVPKPLISID